MILVNPHTLSEKLRRVIDAGYVTVEEIARLSGSSPRTVRQIASGAIVRVQIAERERISRVLSPHFRAHPELYEAEPEKMGRGVFTIKPAQPGRVGYSVWTSRGEWLGDYWWPVERATEARVQWLWRQLDLADPLIKAMN